MSPGDSILVLGAGSWGTALALLLARNGHRVSLWAHRAEHVAQLQQDRCNRRYLPDIAFPENLVAVADLAPALARHRQVLIATPCSSLPDLLPVMAQHQRDDLCLSWACKGFYPGSTRLVHQEVTRVLGAIPQAVISGPTFAGEVARDLPAAVTVASENADYAQALAATLHGTRFRAYTSGDVTGVEIGGAIKNVMAIAAGIADGLEFGANTRAALITRGLAEMMRLGDALGARRDTFMGLAGLGDLALTCTDNQSRNRRLGLALAAGKSVEEAAEEIGQVTEGAKTARLVRQLANERGIEMPITEQVCQVLEGDSSPLAAVAALLSRQPGSELG